MIPEAFIRLLEKYETSELSQAEMERFKKLLKNPDVKVFMRAREQLEFELNQLAQTKLDESMVDSLIPQITNEIESRLLIHGVPADVQWQDDVVATEGGRAGYVKKWFGYVGASVAAAACIGMAVLLYPQIQSEIERPLDEGLYSDVVTQKSQVAHEESASSMERAERAEHEMTEQGAAGQGDGAQETGVQGAGSQTAGEQSETVKKQTSSQLPTVANGSNSVMYSMSESSEQEQRKSNDAGSSTSSQTPVVKVPPVKNPVVKQIEKKADSGSQSNVSPLNSSAEDASPPKQTTPSTNVNSGSATTSPAESNHTNPMSLKTSNDSGAMGMGSMGSGSQGLEASYNIQVQGALIVIYDKWDRFVAKSAYVVRSDAEQVYPVGWQVYGEVYRYKVIGPAGAQYFDMNVHAGTETKVK